MPDMRPLPPGLDEQSSLRPRDAPAHGMTARQLRGRRFTHVTRGHYRQRRDGEYAHRRALLAALPDGAALSHGTAAAVLGLPTIRGLAGSAATEATVPAPVIPARRADLRCHGRMLLPGDRILVNGLSITSAERLFLDAAGRLRLDWLVALGDAILRSGRATYDDLAARVAVAHRVRGVVRARAALLLLDDRAQSPPESVVRVRLGAADIPLLPQCPVRDRAGRVVAHVDLGDSVHRVAVEYEGRQHAEGEQFDRDIGRYSLLSSLDWLVVRAGRADLRGNSGRLIDRTRAALATRSTPPPPARPAPPRPAPVIMQ